MPDAWSHFAPVKMDLFRILALGQAALFLAGTAGKGRRLGGAQRDLPALVPGFVLIVAGALAMAWAVGGHGKPLGVLDGILGAGLFLILAVTADSALAGKMLAVNAASAGLAAVYGLAQYSGFDLFAWRQGFAGSAPASTYGNPLFLGDGLAAALPFALLGMLSPSRKSRLYSLALSLVLSLGLLVAQARGAWLGALAGLAVFFALTLRDVGDRKAWFGAWLAGLAAIMLWAIFPGPLNPGGGGMFRKAQTLVEQGGGGFRGRLLLWESTGRMARNAPLFGAGAGEFAGRYNQYQGPLLASPRYAGLEYHSTGHAHQDYLQMAAETGVAGLGLFIWLVAAVLAGPGGVRGPASRARVAAVSGLTVLLVDGFFNGPLHVPPSAQWAWMLLGLAAAAPAGGAVAVPVRISRARYALLALALVLLARPFARDLVGEVYMRDAQAALEEGRPELALAGAVNSFALAVEDRRHCFLLGRAYYLSGRFSESAEQFAVDALENPGMASAWHNLGLSLAQVGRSGLAVQAFRRALLLDPTDQSLPGLIQEAEKAVRAVKKGN
jgi:O-antigen ligase